MSATPTVQKLMFSDDGEVPNNPVLPVVLMQGAVDPGAGASTICGRMAANDWGGNWTWTVFDYHHYHPNAHEALAVASGWAEILLGGAAGQKVRVVAGDAVVLPAGTGHCRVGASDDFTICGGYPPGQHDYQIVRADGPYPAETRDRITAVTLPVTDPIFGSGGPLPAAWQI